MPVLILLPPSETKFNRATGQPVDPSRWSFPVLNPARATLADHLRDVSESPTAATILGVPSGKSHELERNLQLATAPATPAIEVYTGVLYDALGYATLSSAARRRARERLTIVSALYGALRVTDAIAAYRLSMGVNLPGIGPLTTWWRQRLDGPLTDASGSGLIIDCRSSTYAAAWTPSGELAHRWVQIRVPGATHNAKHTRGLFARYLCDAAPRARTPQTLATAARDAFDVDLTPPRKTGAAWVLDVSARVPS